MLHRGYLRRGVSLEVIVEEDDNAEVSFDPSTHEDEESDCTRSSSSSTSSAGAEDARPGRRQKRDRCKSGSRKGGGGKRNNLDRLQEEQKGSRRRRADGDEERRKRLGRQRSLSCETLTILDVGDDELSREQWEEEARDWDNTEGSTGESHIHHSISRRKILASRTVDQNGIESQNEETPVDDPELDTNQRVDSEKPVVNGFEEAELEDGRSWDPIKADRIEKDLGEKAENQEDLMISKVQTENRQTPLPENNGDDINSDSIQISKSHYSGSEPSSPSPQFEEDAIMEQTNGSPTFPNPSPDMWLRDTLNDGEDSWITVGELENGVDDHEMQQETNHETDTRIDPSTEMEAAKDGNKTKLKEVRFSDELEFVSDEITDKNAKEHHPQNNDQTVKITEFRAISPAQPLKSEQRPQSPVQDQLSEPFPSPPDPNQTKEHQEEDVKYCPTCEVPEDPSTPHQDHLVSVERGRTLFEGTQKIARKRSPLHNNPSVALENRDIIIFERNPTPAVEEEVESFMEQEEKANGIPYNVHNTELHPEELPPPHTVSSVRQLFESVPTVTLHDIHHFNFPSRFDHVRSNPSSKILRFDSRREPKVGLDTNGASKRNLCDLTSNHARDITGLQEGRGYFPPKKLGLLCHRAPEDYCSTGVHLRKPRLARVFDVKKALLENPRYFHIRVNNKDKCWEQPNGSQISTKKSSLNRRNTITYSYVEAKHQNYRGSTTTLRWTKETIDRSDAESLSSDSSEDSGVSRDFSSSIISAFTSSSKKNSRITSSTLLASHEHTSDPSFKWIDPAVLSKIRALGTTVIYFGPRHRPQNRSSPRSEEPMRTTYKDDIIFRVNRDDDCTKRSRTQNGSLHNPSTHSAGNATPNNVESSPRIVGVTAKSIANGHGGNWDNSPESTFPRDLRKLCKREVTRVNSTGQNSIVYDFT